ncbi:pectinesterase family protein [Kosakonia sacchari]|uniref:pectinesterase family protein n=1 Tax=Kosakonia sacchari TaxID=1158459 RepID=UPI000BE53220|nr:pectinesterase family protein [Kosakonia sacchari]PDO88695.1 pectinesterase A [Kosakonia sacchari]
MKTLHCSLHYSALLLACISVSAQASEWNAIVSTAPQTGEFATISQALAAAPDSGTPWRILVKEGRWNERLVIEKPVTLVGQSKEQTQIEANTPAGALGCDGQKLGTGRTSTVEVRASGVTIENLTIRNSFDFPANAALADGDAKKLKDTQAVALMVSENVDKARLRHVRLEGYQDTFYSKSGSRSYFTDCEVSGHVDFIFGPGIAVFDRCEIIARNRNDIAPPYGYITAPATQADEKFGLLIINSKLSKEAGVPAKSFALGRPWHPTTQFSDGRYADPNAIGLAAFINCEIDDHIYGWDKMSGKDKAGEKIWFYPEDSRFYEFDNRGPGAGQGGTKYQLSKADAAQYNLAAIFSGWDNALLE